GENALRPLSDPALRAGILAVRDAKSESDQRRALEALRANAGERHEPLVQQLESDDPGLRAALGNVLSEYEDRSLDRGASFTPYAAWLEREPPPGLVRHLFETDAD